jgi:hypothetical protein
MIGRNNETASTFAFNFHFFFLRNASATEYYVDYSNGSDSNSGIAQNSPFQHCPGDPNASDNAANVVLSPGDIVTFKAGVDYKGQVIISNSGTEQNYILFRGSTNWGTGKSIFDMENSREYGFKSLGAEYFIQIERIEFLHYKDGSDHVIQIGADSKYWRLENCAFGYMETWVADEKHPAIQLDNNQRYIYISNCEFFAQGHYSIKIVGAGAQNIYIQNCNFGGINRGNDEGYISVAVLLRGECSNIYIQDNVFHDYWKYGGDQNPELHHSPDLIHTYATDGSSPGPDHIFIERNYFYSDHQFNTGTGTGDMSISTNTSYVYIRNNLFVNSCQWWGGSVLVSNGADYVWVENNTFIMRNYLNPSNVYGLKVYISGSAEAAGDNIYIYNNIFFNEDDKSSATCIEFFDGNTFNGECDYNSYYTFHGNEDIIGYGGLKNLSEMQALGFDIHSIFEINGSDIFNYFPSFPENSSSGDYSLNPGFASNQIDHGLTRAGFSDSFDGTTRPQGSAWDIGAYEIQTGPDVTPPELQGATINNPIQVTLFFSENLDPQSAQNVSNYNIDNSINVISAFLISNNRDVRLTTSEHDTNQLYTVTINDVTDLSGNLISPENNSAQYELIINIEPVFPVDLFGTPETVKTVIINLVKPGNVSDSTSYNFTAFVPDHGGNDPPEGHAFINGNGPLELYPGATQDNGNNQTESFMLNTPSSWWVNGENELKFVRLYSTGFRIDTAFATFEGVSEEEEENNTLGNYALMQNYPNPFNPTTNISFTLPVDSKVRIAVYNLMGEEVAELANSDFISGNHIINFDATEYTSGVYFYRLKTNEFVETKKMILIK